MIVRPQDRQGVGDVFLWVRLRDVLRGVSLDNKRSWKGMDDLCRLVINRGIVIPDYSVSGNIVDDKICPALVGGIIVLDGVVNFDGMGDDER